ncbi:MAG: leucyl aminopeptidase [Rhodospirillaceae bacterium]|nr:leucyl aminopeptidase [Rhodospirillaceae bacterium]
MKIDIVPRLPASASVLVVGAYEGRQLAPSAAALDRSLGGALQRAMEGGRFTGARDQYLDLIGRAGIGPRRLLLVGLGKKAELAALAAQEIGGRIENALATLGESAAVIALDVARDLPAHVAFGAQLAGQRFMKFRTKPRPEDPKPVRRLTIVASATAATGRSFARLDAVADGVATARGLVNDPANLLGPDEFVRRAQALKRLGVQVEALDESQMRRLGMGALLAVGQGSARRPRLLVLHWKGPKAKAGRGPLAFVGKGVCFDAGGISIKKAAGMEEMKGDMAGAAAVVGAMQVLAERKAPIEVVGVAALVENLASESSYRPGDVLTTMSGQTVEVIDTDAEGRLILIDALHYTATRFKPRAIVDLATLTYAVGAALGHVHAGLLSNDDALAKRLLAAGNLTGERLWRLPLDKDYEANLESSIADLRQVAPDSEVADAVHGAQLLQRFIGKTPWAHLDIAYTGLFASKPKPTQPKGATGFGVRLLDALAASYEA